MQRSFSTRSRPGSFAGEGFTPGFPGHAGRNVIRLPEGSYTGDPGPFWQKTARGKPGEEIVFVQSALASTDDPIEKLGNAPEPGSEPEAESEVDAQRVAAEPVPEPASEPPEPAPELEPQGEPERKPLIWKAFPE